ncbi:MAG: hypothetical protein PVI40_00385 [Chlamydiota bacterium]
MNKKNLTFDKKDITFFCFISIFIWIGFVCSISFMEAWLKFRTPNLSLEVGLSVGQLVFKALNKVEWTLAIFLMICSFLAKKKLKVANSIFLYLPLSILIIQTYWLLPALSERVEAVLQGISLSKSFIHFYYIFLEVFKVIFLFLLGIKMFKDIKFDNSRKEESML